MHRVVDCVIEMCVCVCVSNRIFGPTLRLRTVKKFEQTKRLQKFEAWSKGQGRAGNERERENVAPNIFVIAPRFVREERRC